MTTPKAITFIVVGGLCLMALTYMGTLSACVVFGIEPKNEIMRSLEAAGMYVLGAFTGILVNTRSQTPEPPTSEVHARSNADTNIHPAADAAADSANPSA